MLSTIISRYNVIVIINVIFTAFFDYNYKLRRFKISYKRLSSIFITLKHRFLKEKDNVINVFLLRAYFIFLIKLSSQ